MNGAVAAAGGDMAKAALQAGWSTGSANAARSKLRLARAWRRRRQRGSALTSASSSPPMSPRRSTGSRQGPDRRRHHRRQDRRRQGRRPEPPAATRIAAAIEKGLRDKGVKALVVRVDSPGGSVLASERIRQALLDAKAQKIPIVVSMGNVAASGGYWVSTPATTSSPSRRRSPVRSACSGCCRASRARWPSSGSAPTASRPRRCRASRTCSRARRPRPAS